jgi:hypothetical protein
MRCASKARFRLILPSRTLVRYVSKLYQFFSTNMPLTHEHCHIVAAILRDLCDSLSPPFIMHDCSLQVKIIRWLTDPEPANRPSVPELLASELLPPKIEDEHLKGICPCNLAFC